MTQAKTQSNETLSIDEVGTCQALVLNAPQFFDDPEFQAWLNNGEPKFTWHKKGVPGDGSDVVVLVDPMLSGDGSDSDMPEHIWDSIIEVCRQKFRPGAGNHIMVRLMNLR